MRDAAAFEALPYTMQLWKEKGMVESLLSSGTNLLARIGMVSPPCIVQQIEGTKT
jgi:hypothetical protein